MIRPVVLSLFLCMPATLVVQAPSDEDTQAQALSTPKLASNFLGLVLMLEEMTCTPSRWQTQSLQLMSGQRDKHP